MRQSVYLATTKLKPLRRWFVPLLAVAALSIAGAACSDDDSDVPTLSDPTATATELTNEYFRLLAEQDSEGLASFLSDGFMIQRADGSYSAKDEYLANLSQIDIGEYTISDVSARQAGAALVVRWTVTVDEQIHGSDYATVPAPRISTFVYEDGDWRLLSHANFNAPPAAGASGGAN